MRPHTTIFTVVLLLSWSGAASAAAPPPSAEHVLCGGVAVRVERFLPAGQGRRPAVLLLHGADGMHDGGPFYRAIARGLADRGYVAVLVHYFDRTATKGPDVPALLVRFRAYFADPERWADVEGVFAPWLEAVEAALDAMRRHDRVDADRVGVVGLSLGGFLATSAAVRSGGVRCVVSLFGGLPRPLRERAAKMPPSLLIHGDADEVVPVRETLGLRDLLQRQSRPCEVKIYRGAGHAFATRDGGRDWPAALDAQVAVAAFLARHLGQAAPEPEAVGGASAPAAEPADPPPADAGRNWAGLLLAGGCAIVFVAVLLAARRLSARSGCPAGGG